MPVTRRLPDLRRRRLAAGVAVVGTLVRDTDKPPADTLTADGARVVAHARDCQALTVEVDGWRFENRSSASDAEMPVGARVGDDPATPPSDATVEPARDPFDGWDFPRRWHGDDIPGRLRVEGPIEGSGQGGFEARFVAEDGIEISMYGYPPDAEVFHTLGCPIGNDPTRVITDRYAELAAEGPLPPVVGPESERPNGYRYAGMRSTGSGADQSVMLRFERRDQTVRPDYEACLDGLPPDAPEREQGCGPAEDLPATLMLVCVTNGKGCREASGEARWEVHPDPAVGSARTYLIGTPATLGDWAEVTYTSDVTRMARQTG